MIKNEIIFKKLKEEKVTSYIDSLFRENFMKNIYTQFEYLSFMRMINIIEIKEWWFDMNINICYFIMIYSNY